MKTITLKDIMSWGPCYDPVAKGVLPSNWSGNALDILTLDISYSDKKWAVLRKEALDEKTLRLFACICARQALNLIPNPDPRSLSAIEVAERHAHGEASNEELKAARAEAWAAWAEAAWAAWAEAARVARAEAARVARAAAEAAWAAAEAAGAEAAEAAENQLAILIQLIVEEEKE